MDRKIKITLIIVISFLILSSGFLAPAAHDYYEEKGLNAPFYPVIYPILKIVGYIYQTFVILVSLGIIWAGLSVGWTSYRGPSSQPWWQ